MGKAKYVGITQNDDGSWSYRLKMKLPSGKVYDTKIKKDTNNLPFLTARSAYEAKRAHEERIRSGLIEKGVRKRYTLEDVYNNYLKTEAKEKAPATLKKQDSMWRNHVSKVFKDKDINEITIVELNTFLSDLYREYSYKYVEGFIKFLYLLFGHADRMEIIDGERYNRLFVDKNKRLKMPPIKQEDKEQEEADVKTYDRKQIKELRKIFDNDDCNLRAAFYLGLCAGLRISECFGLRWQDVDFEKRTISINRQMHYLDGELKLSRVKTLKSVRVIPMSDELYTELDIQYQLQMKYKAEQGKFYRDTERIYDEIDKKWIVGGDFVNRKANGELLTVNSIKYWAKKIKDETGIDFKYHVLRHTFASNCAYNNVNMYYLMDIMGHKKIDTTKKYYINPKEEVLMDRTREVISMMYQPKTMGWYDVNK